MSKRTLFLFLVFCFLYVLVLAQQEESLIITTYYPSPHGVYNELRTNKLALGGNTETNQPTMIGDITFKPQGGDPATWPAGQIGELAYSSAHDAFYHWNGSAWVRQAGAGPGSWNCQLVTNSTSGSNEYITARAICPVGFTLITGGCASQWSIGDLRQSHPSDNSWICGKSTGPVQETVTAYAWCCQ